MQYCLAEFKNSPSFFIINSLTCAQVFGINLYVIYITKHIVRYSTYISKYKFLGWLLEVFGDFFNFLKKRAPKIWSILLDTQYKLWWSKNLTKFLYVQRNNERIIKYYNLLKRTQNWRTTFNCKFIITPRTTLLFQIYLNFHEKYFNARITIITKQIMVKMQLCTWNFNKALK